MATIREEVMAGLTEIAADAISRGEDGMRAVQAACPGIPIEVAVEAELNASDARTEAWWEAIERTIDGELIRRSLAAVGDPAD